MNVRLDAVSIFAATANALRILFCGTEQRRGIFAATANALRILFCGTEGDQQKRQRHEFLRTIGYNS